jgi:hypothetical protein
LQQQFAMKPWRMLTAKEKLAVYLFAAIVGRLGGFIVNAVQLYVQIGWNATWIQINA